jgi:hypothetical protein
MNLFFIIMMVLAMLATVTVLVIGIVGMAKGGEFNQKYGNKLMNLRVLLQAVALLFLALAIITQQ